MAVIEFIERRKRAFVVFFFAILALKFFRDFAVLGTHFSGKWTGVILGLSLMILAIPFHWNGKKWKWGYLISFLLNSIGSGFSVSSYYVAKVLDFDGYLFLLWMLPSIGILSLVALMLEGFRKSKKVTILVACILNGLLTIGALIFWIKDGPMFFSQMFFASLISFFYLGVFAVTINHEERSVLRDISFGAFGSLIIITVVVVLILSGGDLLDGADIGGGDGKKKGKKVK